jgi:hypothetical protein
MESASSAVRVIWTILKNASTFYHSGSPPPLVILPKAAPSVVGMFPVLPKLRSKTFDLLSHMLEVLIARNVGTMGATAELFFRCRFGLHSRTTCPVDASPGTTQKGYVKEPSSMFTWVLER